MQLTSKRARPRIGVGRLLLALAAGACAAGGASRSLPTRLATGGGDLSFHLPTLDGSTLDTADLLGEVVLVDVWATWCDPCEKSFPFYARLQRELGPRGFRVVAVSVDERIEDVRTWVESRGLPFVVVHDPAGTVPDRIGLRTMPSAVLLDRHGKVAGVHAGFEPSEEPQIERMIREVVEAPR